MKELLHKKWLDSHINFEVRAGKVEGLSLEQAQQLLELLGNPQKQYRAIHLTGTNGKGSTAHILTHLLMALGFNVGTYASPHVVALNERIQFNGSSISDDELELTLGQIKEVEESSGTQFSWFEIMTASAFQWFAQKNIDIAVIEVGKLGRFDATNVIDAEVCVVTNISKDHIDESDNKGEWEKAITWEKAGIIKSKVSLVSGVFNPDLRNILEAEDPGNTYYLDEDLICKKNQQTSKGRLLDVQIKLSEELEFKNLILPLHGAHQGTNATLALGAAQAFLEKTDSGSKRLTLEAIEKAFMGVKLPGRFEILSEKPLLIIDGGHNPAGAQAASLALDDYLSLAKVDKSQNSTLIFGITQEKSIQEMLATLKAETFTNIICTNLPTPRTRDCEELDKVAKHLGLNSVAIQNPTEALEAGIDSDLIFVCGSLYLAGAIKEIFINSKSNVKVNA